MMSRGWIWDYVSYVEIFAKRCIHGQFLQPLAASRFVRPACAGHALDSVSPDETCARSFCAVTTNSAHLDTRRGFGGYPIGQPPYLMPKGEGTIAWRQSGGQRAGAETVDPQDLHDVVKAAWLAVQFSSVQGRPMGRAPDDKADLARDR